MIDAGFQDELINILDGLSAEGQLQVVQYARALAERPLGKTGKEILKFAGTLPDDDARDMIAAIEEGCEQIDWNEW
jgi:hypothetical protein